MNCHNCRNVTEQVQVGSEICCLECGVVLDEYFDNYLIDYEENINPTYFNSIIRNYDPFNFFKRRLRCIMGNQRVFIDNIFIQSIKNNLDPKYWNEFDMRRFLKFHKLTTHYINIYLILEYLYGYKEPFDRNFINDLSYLYEDFLFLYFKNTERPNATKTPPVEFTCRCIILKFIEYINEENILISYEPEDYLKYFKDMKSKKRIDNLNIINKIMQEMNFNNIKIKYKFMK